MVFKMFVVLSFKLNWPRKNFLNLQFSRLHLIETREGCFVQCQQSKQPGCCFIHEKYKTRSPSGWIFFRVRSPNPLPLPVLALEISLINNLHACTSFTRVSQVGGVQRKPDCAALSELFHQLSNPSLFPRLSERHKP